MILNKEKDLLMIHMKNIAIIGTGVIGASWAAFYLSKGFYVYAYDPALNAEENLRSRIRTYLLDLKDLNKDLENTDHRSIQEIMLNLQFCKKLQDAVRNADFIQENGPERIELKKELYEMISKDCPAQTIIASSSSGLKVTDIQKYCIYPERVVLGHPFNPPHLLPLVEIIGGEQTEQGYIDKAFEFYKQLGKKPILIKKEIKGHVANRLQSAIWREAFYLVTQGVCSAEDIDTAISNGPGLRWAIYGPFLNMQLANQNGFKAAMHHLGEPMTQWWEDMKPFHLNEEIINNLDEQTQSFIEKLEIADLATLRDDTLLKILKLKKDYCLP